MKKMKGVVPYATVYEDQRAMFKHQSLLQDYEELYKETEAKKKKLEMMKQRKLTLLDEVRFLRRRYRYLTQNQSQNMTAGRTSVHPRTLLIEGKSVKKRKNYTGNQAALRCPAPRPDSNRKGKIQKEQGLMLQNPAAILDLNLRQKTHIVKEAELWNSADISYSSQRERMFSGKEATIRNNTPIFDLNQISREEEELQDNSEIMRVDEPQMNITSNGNDEQHNDMKLLACRSIGSGSSQAGKRKISWQDPVALRV